MRSAAFRARLGLAAVGTIFFLSTGILGYRALENHSLATKRDLNATIGAAHRPPMESRARLPRAHEEQAMNVDSRR